MSRKLSLIVSLVLFAIAVGTLTASAYSPPSTAGPKGPNGSDSLEATCPPDGQCFADVLPSNPFYAFINRIYQQDIVSGYACGGPGEPCDPESRPYYRAVNNVTRQQMAKFIDNARSLPSIVISTTSATAPISVTNSSDTAIFGRGGPVGVQGESEVSVGVLGSSTGGDGVLGVSEANVGVTGMSTYYEGVYGTSDNSTGVVGEAHGGGYGVEGIAGGGWAGVYGHSTDSSGGTGVIGVADGTGSVGVAGSSNGGLAGYFHGNVSVTGNLSKGGGSFKIDDPIDPANKYLYHSFVESPDMMNFYNGTATLDNHGEAWVEMPAWFDALNRDFHYQLTALDEAAPDLHIAQRMQDGRFKIAGGKPGMQVEWQVTGVRQDPYANAHRIPVEEDKPADEKGKYLYPTEYGQPESKGIDYERQQEIAQPRPIPAIAPGR